SPANGTPASSWPGTSGTTTPGAATRDTDWACSPRRPAQRSPLPGTASPDPTATDPRRADQRVPARRITSQVRPCSRISEVLHGLGGGQVDPTEVHIDADAVQAIRSVASRLRRQKADPNQVFSDTFVQLRHET